MNHKGVSRAVRGLLIIEKVQLGLKLHTIILALGIRVSRKECNVENEDKQINKYSLTTQKF